MSRRNAIVYRLAWLIIATLFTVAYWQSHPDQTLYGAYVGPRPQDSLGFLLIIVGIYRFGYEKVVNEVAGPVWMPFLLVAAGCGLAAIG